MGIHHFPVHHSPMTQWVGMYYFSIQGSQCVTEWETEEIRGNYFYWLIKVLKLEFILRPQNPFQLLVYYVWETHNISPHGDSIPCIWLQNELIKDKNCRTNNRKHSRGSLLPGSTSEDGISQQLKRHETSMKRYHLKPVFSELTSLLAISCSFTRLWSSPTFSPIP